MSGLRSDRDTVKLVAFTTVMLLVAGSLLVIFSDHRSGDTKEYSAVFTDASGLSPGDTVRIAGIRVGTVGDVELRSDESVRVVFDVDSDIGIPAESGAAVRYLNLVGDRYLELTEGPGDTMLTAGAEIPASRTKPALDLDVLLGGLKPVIDGLEPQQVNALSASVLDVLQGQRGTVRTLFEGTSSLFTTLGENVDVIEDVIVELQKVMATLDRDSERFSDAIDRLDVLSGDLARQRDPIGAAITALDSDKPALENALVRAPENFRKLVRTGTYGNFIQYYVCAVTVRVSDPSGKVFELPWIEQTKGRCSD